MEFSDTMLTLLATIPTAEERSVSVYQSKPGAVDELKQNKKKNRDTFVAVSLKFLRNEVECGSSRLQKHLQSTVQVKLTYYRYVEDPRISRQSTHEGGKVVSHAHRPSLPPQGRYLVLVFVRLSRPQGLSAVGRIKSIKNSSVPIGYRTHDLTACGTVPNCAAAYWGLYCSLTLNVSVWALT